MTTATIKQKIDFWNEVTSLNKWYGYMLMMSCCALLAAIHHNAKYYIEMESFVDMIGENPFQSRVLVFLILGLLGSPFERGSEIWFMVNDYLCIFLDAVSLYVASYILISFLEGYSLKAKSILLGIFYWQIGWMFNDTIHFCFYFPYDWPSIFFFALWLWLSVYHYNKFLLLAVVMILATLTRETVLFFIPIYMIVQYAYGRGIKGYISTALVFLGVWLSIKVMLKIIFMHNPGGAISFYHLDNLAYPRYLRNLLLVDNPDENGNVWSMMKTFGYLWVLFPFLKLPKTPLGKTIKYCMWLLIPFWFGMLLVGNLDEVRIFGEFTLFTSFAIFFSLKENKWIKY